MNTQDRAVVKALLQYMATKSLTGSDEFRAALKHFNVTTAHTGQMVSDECAKVFGHDNNYFVDVLSPDTIDNHPHGLRATSNSKAETEAYAADARARGDEPVNTRVLNARAYHAETLVINIEAARAEAHQWNDFLDSFDGYIKEECMVDFVHAEALAINDARAIIMRTIHVAANSFGGVIGEAEELVVDLTKIGRADLGLKVESLMDAVECDINKEHDAQRANFRRGLHAIANAL